MIALGIILGLLAAAFQSLCYVYTRLFVLKPGHKASSLLALSHVWMGLFSLMLLPFVFDATMLAHPSLYAWPLLGSVAFYMVGQMCLIFAVAWTDASRVSPLLGLKILVLAVIAVLIFGNHLTPLQWLSVLMSLTAAVAMNYSGGGTMPLKSMLAVLGACVCYSFSDLCIVALVRALAPQNQPAGILLSVALAYLLAGLIGAGLSLTANAEDRSRAKWRAALPVGITWFFAMVFLFISLRHIGAVFGNIVQAIRGPLSIIIGMAIASRGHVALESRVSRWVLARRFAAALLMCGAIALFAHERARVEREHDTGVHPSDRPPTMLTTDEHG